MPLHAAESFDGVITQHKMPALLVVQHSGTHAAQAHPITTLTVPHAQQGTTPAATVELLQPGRMYGRITQ